jgi:3-phenylpropionate/trans-cinnamate dioxygenase ferredoxin subunit
MFEKKQSSLFLFGLSKVRCNPITAVAVMTNTPFVPALPIAELAAGTMRCVTLNGVAVVLVHAKDGGVHALHDICTHAFAQLHEGRLRGHRLICPLHGASFDVRTGAVLGAPATAPLKTFATRVVDGVIEVQRPTGIEALAG